jgi:hypothetical protein
MWWALRGNSQRLSNLDISLTTTSLRRKTGASYGLRCRAVLIVGCPDRSLSTAIMIGAVRAFEVTFNGVTLARVFCPCGVAVVTSLSHPDNQIQQPKDNRIPSITSD